MDIVAEIAQSFSPEADGFLFMWVLALVALAAAALVVERWIEISRRTDVDASSFVDNVKDLIDDGETGEAYQLCVSGGRRALPRILGAGIYRSLKMPQLIQSAMEEESLHMIPILERRVSYILMLGNVSTLLGLMGTIYGLILSFAAVGRSDVAAAEKSSLLAAGISTAMNTTLFGLMIAVPCILIYSFLRAKIETSIKEFDRHAVSVLKSLLPRDVVQKDYRVTGRRITSEEDTEPNIAPMMNLMVILIPLLLTSAEFVKIGAIELKLPESAQATGGEEETGEELKDVKLDLGIAITAEGFDLFHYFKARIESQAGDGGSADVPLVDGEYDYETLNSELAEVKRRALAEIARASFPSAPEHADLAALSAFYEQHKEGLAVQRVFSDHESVKIVAEEKIAYQTVVSVMDAARGTRTAAGVATLFPNVSLAGGIVH